MDLRGIFFAIIFFGSSFSAFAQFTGDDLIFDAGELGIVKGQAAKTTHTGRPYVEILGIPFAEPMSSDTRFLPPVNKTLPLAPDGQTFSATRKPACCPQPGSNILCLLNQKDDCLGMNIYTPVIQKDGKFDKLLPVIVFIHGGAFILGSGDAYSGARLLERDVVVVNFNYRLGIFGFFSLGNDDAPGNAAMYDMVMALQFVKKHIHNFGGDPNLITIAGQSAGSVAVTHLLLSPLTRNRGLFHRAIAMSGSAMLEWGTITNYEAKISSLELAKSVGCYDGSGNTDGVADCLRGKPASELVKALDAYQLKEKNNGRLGFAPAAPTIQSNMAQGKAFLDESPQSILERHEEANVPLMMGSVRHDGSFVLGVIYNQFLKFNKLANDTEFLRTEFVPKCLNALGIRDEAQVKELTKKYIGEKAVNSGNLTLMLPGLIDLHTAYYFKEQSLKTLQLHSEMQPQSYWYEFDYAGKRSVYTLLVNTKGNPVRGGICHGDDMIYIFNVPLMSLATPEEQAVSDRLVDYWANFAATGNPNVDSKETYFTDIDESEWPAYSKDSPAFVKIDANDTFFNDHPRNHWVGNAMDLYPELIGEIDYDDETTPDDPGFGDTEEPETTPGAAPLSTSSSLAILLISFVFMSVLR